MQRISLGLATIIMVVASVLPAPRMRAAGQEDDEKAAESVVLAFERGNGDKVVVTVMRGQERITKEVTLEGMK